MNRHSNDGAGSKVPSISKNAPTVSAPVSTSITVSPISLQHAAQEFFFRPQEDSGGPPTPLAQPAPRRKPPQQQPVFAHPAKANDERPRPTNPLANAQRATAVPDNRSTRTSESRKTRGWRVRTPASVPTTFPTSNCLRIRCVLPGWRGPAENQSASRARKIKSAATTKPIQPPRKM